MVSSEPADTGAAAAEQRHSETETVGDGSDGESVGEFDASAPLPSIEELGEMVDQEALSTLESVGFARNQCVRALVEAG